MKNESLFKTLAADVQIFAAAREGYFSFYYSGFSIFQYRPSTRFTTHQKFALILPDSPYYVGEKAIFKGGFSNDFAKDYQKIKTNVRLHQKEERAFVNVIAAKNSYREPKPVVVLDIEKTIVINGKQMELDMVLLKGNSIRFVEAKLYGNKDVFSFSVWEQIRQYEEAIKAEKQSILEYYAQRVAELNSVFDLQLSSPVQIEDKIVLLIFDYEKVQWDHRLKPFLQSPEISGYLYYAVGDPNKCSVDQLYQGKPCGFKA